LDGFPDILAVAVREGGVDRVPILLFNIPGKDAGTASVKAHARRALEQEANIQQLLGLKIRDTVNMTEAGVVRSSAAAKSTSLRRTFRSAKHGTEALSEITDARGVTFLDLDEDVSISYEFVKLMFTLFVCDS
jgi:hypothetical protein